MAIMNCKSCGGAIDIAEGITVYECEYCGRKQTMPCAHDERKLSLFSRANQLRLECRFDQAAGVYESIVADFPEEAEAYWGMLLCHYGIEYVDDIITNKKIPTCHRSSFTGVMEDSNYQAALQHADAKAREVYEADAKEIEAIRRGIIAVSSNEEPYDIFICYKETDQNGDRTIDSEIANDVYEALTAKGYRVFFSRISLEDKLGVEYEPFIFAALHSAKVMLAFGTCSEHYNAVWVKNEWSRYLRLMAKGENKMLIPCFKEMKPNGLPKEFGRLQAQDMGKVGALTDLLRGIEKIVPLQNKVEQPSAPNTNQLYLDNGKYEGETFANQPDGFGVAHYDNGDVYEGHWKQGRRQGQGKITWGRGGVWEGEFNADQVWNGSGIVYRAFANDTVFLMYEGEYREGKRHGQGTQHYEDGVHIGAWINDACEGQGKFVWSKGGEWNGEFHESKRWNGSGVWHYSDGYFEGQFVNGVRHGQGKYVWNDGGEWVGEFRDDQRWNGSGIHRYSDGYFEGSFAEGVRNGFGKYVWDDGDVYEGQWSNDRRNGQGKYTWPTGTYYEGEWLNSNRHGQGKNVWHQGGQWEGEYRDDKMWQGFGIDHYDNGYYQGAFAGGQRHGQGKYVWNDGDVYEGEWHEGQRHGQGKYTWHQGGEWVGEYRESQCWNGSGVRYYGNDRYDGTIVKGQRNGQGTYIWENGNVYEGAWKDDQRNGRGKLVFSAGGEFTGEFRNDEIWKGTGTLHYDIGRYDGEFVNGQRHGHGKFTWYEGGEWVGRFRDDKRWKGTGIIRYTDGVYDGEVANGLRNGKGKFTWTEGGEWIGRFKDNVRWKGTGTVHFDNGDRYEGPIANGKRHGKGKMIWAEGGQWTGEFREDQHWKGTGTIYYQDGRYEGAFVGGVRNGHGTFTWNDGGEWEGKFRKDAFWKGGGTMYFYDGSSRIVITRRGNHK